MDWQLCLPKALTKGNNYRKDKIVTLIAEEYLNQLREAGLHVSHPIPAFGSGVWVCKPKSTPGHSIPEIKTGYVTIDDDGPQCPELDAPMLKFMHLDDVWRVDGQDSSGGMGPADFIDEWTTPQEAIRDILDFYFGDPARMAMKAEEKSKISARRKPVS